MVKDALFDRMELGSWLREARRSAGLSQDDVAARMGLTGRGRKNFVSQLETGKVKDPVFLTIVRFTRACGVKMADFGLHFVLAGQPPFDAGLIDGSDLPAARKQNLTWRLPGQVHKYQNRLRFPTQPHGKPIPPEKVRAATKKFQDYRVQASLVEGAARLMLDQQDFPGTDYGGYLAMTRKILSILRRYRGPLRVEKLAAIAGLVHKWGLDPKVVEKLKAVVIEAYRKLTPS